MQDNYLPQVSALLQSRYQDNWRAYRASTPYPLPKRRVKKKPLPGVVNADDPENG